MTVTTRDEELLARVREMRERGSAPKQIAKALGLRPAQATALVRRVAEAALGNIAPDERPVVGCWVNAGWSAGLGMAKAPDWAAADPSARSRTRARAASPRFSWPARNVPAG